MSTSFCRTVQPVILARSASQISEMVKNWEKANEKFYGPNRDVKNFPHPTLPERHPPTRMGLFPASWFQALYDKTGVTGIVSCINVLCLYLFL